MLSVPYYGEHWFPPFALSFFTDKRYKGVGGSIKHDIADMFYTSYGYPRVSSGVNRTALSEKPRYGFQVYK